MPYPSDQARYSLQAATVRLAMIVNLLFELAAPAWCRVPRPYEVPRLAATWLGSGENEDA